MTTKKRQLVVAIVTAGLILAVSLGLKLLVSNGFLDAVVSKRVMNALIGLVLVVSGNFIPKTLSPLSDERCDPARGQTLRRFAGWSFVIAGLSYSIIWLVAPIEVSGFLSKSVVATSVLLVAALCVWAVLTRRRAHPPV